MKEMNETKGMEKMEGMKKMREMKEIKKLIREDLEEILDSADNTNNYYNVMLCGDHVRDTKMYWFSHCWHSIDLVDNGIEITVKVIMQKEPENVIVEKSYMLDAENPVESINSYIDECNAVMNADSIAEKADAIGIDAISLISFPMPIDAYEMASRNYLKTLRRALADKKFDISDPEEW